MTGWFRTVRGLLHDAKGNVLVLTAIALIPTFFAIGFAIDYGRAEMARSQMLAAADAAALAATDAIYIQQANAAAAAAARQVFNGQAGLLRNVRYDPLSDVSVVVDDQGALNLGRTVTVRFRARSRNLFGGILGVASLGFSGSAVAYATQAPNINFYLVMDRSPSMLLPATSAGIAAIQKVTGCAFACHAQYPRNDGINVRDSSGRDIFLSPGYYTSGNAGYGLYYALQASTKVLYDKTGTKIGTNAQISGSTLTYKDLSNKNQSFSGYYADGYWLTHNYTKLYPSASTITLRVGEETLAAQNLIPYAQNQASRNAVAYQMQFFAFDWTHPSANGPVTQYGSMTNIDSLSSANVPDLDGTQDWWYANGLPTSSNNIHDMATEFSNTLTAMNSVMAAPGSGAPGGTPQEVMLLITDGVVDELSGGSRRNRELGTPDLAACTTIKNRGIKIAILYTEYLPDVLVGDSWSLANVAPYLSNVLPALQSCASTSSDGTPLVYTVSPDENISNALSALFALTIQSARLIR
ncbi:TadE/TadG family type IV pilus assembly protein [Novosphingobium sp. FKTRR1]|uniref:TadE/TadG family type IV pilus assembly protein n=1 Tax=Novosphingobium sp. FKTRR1 TaxID=2879118 RepID=UPI001CEFEAE3|nr:pilus assembly protein TadG-related protein [Novosphingobium sp. FKTRR1]